MKQLRLDAPGARKIWEYAFDTKGAGQGIFMNRLIEKDSRFERKMRQDIADGKFTPDSVIPLDYFKENAK